MRFRTKMKKWGFKGKRHSRSDKAISTIMANLTMLVIVVFLSTLLFVWSISAFGAYQGGAGYWFSNRSLANQERPIIENVFFCKPTATTYAVKIYVRNVGTIESTIDSVYINSTRYNITPKLITIGKAELLVGSEGICSGLPSPFTKGALQKITISTTRGTIESSTWVA